jgi:peptidoglycan/LPS O-acetylase OafA/YrhL
MKNQKTNLELVQMLRGIASMFVVMFHATMNSVQILNLDFCFNFFLFGWAGVDVFFVLSGFIITYTTSRHITHTDQFLPFIRRRFVRIFPVYWIVIGLFLIVQLLLPSFYKTGYPFDILTLLSTFLLLPGHVVVNGVSWTMSYELFFYLLFSLAFIISNNKLAFALLALYAMLLVVLPFIIDTGGNVNEGIKLVTAPINIEFFMGVLVAVMVHKIPAKISLLLIISGTLLFLLSAILYNNGYAVAPGEFNRVVLFGLPSFLIIMGIVKYEALIKVRIHNVLLWLGEASYSLYLLHLPLLVAGIRMIKRLDINDPIMKQVLVIELVAIICCSSVLFYKWVEKPLITRLNSGQKRTYAV